MAGVSQELGVILTPAPVSTLQIGQTPNSSFLVSMYWQINKMGAHTPPRQTSRLCSSGSRWLFAALGSFSAAP